VSGLVFRERPADGEPQGLLVLHHGRGADENDLLSLGDALDPGRRLHVATPRAPMTLPGWPGFHWYAVPRVGFPDPDTFRASVSELAAFHDELWARTGIEPERTVLGGFSMGSVMSYALGLGPGRPGPAGLLIFSGFVPTVEGWQADLASRPAVRAFIAHGTYDPVIGVEFGRRAHQLLSTAGLDVDYNEAEFGHEIYPTHARQAALWLDRTLAAADPPLAAG
jgi:phospholipase/carboxylesterase